MTLFMKRTAGTLYQTSVLKVALLLVDLRFFISSRLRSYTADIFRQIYLYRVFQK